MTSPLEKLENPLENLQQNLLNHPEFSFNFDAFLTTSLNTLDTNYLVFTFDINKRNQLENLFVNLSPAGAAVNIFDFFKKYEKYNLNYLEKSDTVLIETFHTGKWCKIHSEYTVFFLW